MDESDGTSLSAQEDLEGSELVKPKSSWNAKRATLSTKQGLASPSSVTTFCSKFDTDTTEPEHRAEGFEEQEDQAREDEFSFGQDTRPFLKSMGGGKESNKLFANDLDELVVDVSPNGHSLDSLDTLIRQDTTALQVKELYVYDNTFTVLPQSLSSFANLKSLKIFSNEVKILPEEVGSIDLLENLQLKIAPTGLGKLPPLGKLKLLKTLELHQTPVRPIVSLPSEISKLKLLTRLAVCNFSISFLPSEIGDLKNLEELDLSFNKLKSLPKEITGLLALKHFRAENNKLIDLPSGFAKLADLSSVDIAHNKLTSLESLGLSMMPSLRVLNAKFNKVRTLGQLPGWITCYLEGNPFCVGDEMSSSDGSAGILDTDLLPLGNEISSPAPVLSQKETFHSKPGRRANTKRGWKRQNMQQLQARQDRLNLSRNLNVQVCKDTDSVQMKERQADMEEQSSKFTVVDSYESLRTCEIGGNALEAQAPQVGDHRKEEKASDLYFGNNNYNQSNHEHLLSVYSEVVNTNDGSTKTNVRSCSSRKVVTGDRDQKHSVGSTDDASIVDGDECKTFAFASKLEPGTIFVHTRRKGSSLDRNPKPPKRRRSSQAVSEVAFKYRTKSIVGFSDHLQDGFYDAGRDCPFVALEVLESQEFCLDSREVILVDRDRDEELDVIASSAQNFLATMELSREEGIKTESCCLSLLQKGMMLSLYVSDCFGGSDKTLNVIIARRAALGGRPNAPFLCSCSSTVDSTFSESNNNIFQGTVPSVHQLSETSVRLLQAQRQSNIVPLGLLPYGVCRHRAILYKYLCDRASIPCELVRGYLDYVPHAWNIILVKRADTFVRMLIDCCRPLDIREERDPEYFCRYIPLRRFQLPSLEKGKLEIVTDDTTPVLLEEIGRGASGSVVKRCTMGSVTAAAKVQVVEHASGKAQDDALSRFLSELRIFCSLTEHPHIVAFYGHEFSSVSIQEDDSKCGDGVMQLRLFMEYVPGVSLETVLAGYAEEGQTQMPVKQAAFISKAIVDALSFVHCKGIVHRDIKSSNVLVDLDGNWVATAPPVKLCDFDSAVPLASSSVHTCYLAHRGIPPVEVCVGTPRWMAPEVFQAMYSKGSYGLEADIWSFGCLIFEMLTLQVPYAGLPEAQIHAYLQAGKRPPLPSKFEQLVSVSADAAINDWEFLSDKELQAMRALVSLFNSCTESAASARPTAEEALKSVSDLVDRLLTQDLDVKVDNVVGGIQDTDTIDLERTFADDVESLPGKTDVSQTQSQNN